MAEVRAPGIIGALFCGIIKLQLRVVARRLILPGHQSNGAIPKFGGFLCYNRSMDSTQIMVALIAAIPTTATALSTVYLNSKRLKDREEAIKRNDEQRKLAIRNAAKASIENMITQDIIRTEILGQMPENRDNIEAEYTDYHNNGGNGRVTREVEEYKSWYRGFKPEKLDKKKIVS